MTNKYKYANINTISTFSFLNSLIKIEDIISFSKKNNMQYAALMDENILYGAISFYLECKKNDIIPVLGLHLKNDKYDCYLVALNYEGYKAIVKLCSFVQLKYEFILEDYAQNIAVIDIKNNIKHVHQFFYSVDENAQNYIAFQTSQYVDKTDFACFKLIEAIAENKTIDDENLKQIIFDKSLGENYLLTSEEAHKKFNEIGLRNLDNLLTNINLEINFNEKHLIKFPLPEKFHSSKQYLQALAIDGLKEKFHSDLVHEAYIDRLKNELKIINDLGFNDYFLVVQEYVNYAKKQGILIGPGRGSAVGSLVAYALNITTIDPLKYNLLFERFLNPARSSMPDIDIDIADTRRQEVIDHLFNFYDTNNQQRVSYIITFQTIKLRTAIRDVGRVLKIDLSIIDKLSKSINFKYDESNPENEIKNSIPQELQSKYQMLFDFVLKVVGLYRQYSMHAAGVVLSNENLYDIIPIQYGNNNLILSQYPMEYLESLGLLKMDLLGLSNLTLLQNILNFVKSQLNKDVDLYVINLNDEQVYHTLGEGDTFGIFQFESPGMTNLLKKVKPVSIEDLSMVSAMFRPGPQSQINDWIKRRNNPSLITYLVPELESILDYTSGLLVYQEQVMQIAVRIANFSLVDADLLRRAISKKHADELRQLKEKFINQAEANHITKTDATKIYDYIFEFASYGFNHSHSIAYAYISYWLAYLKFHYPAQFLQAFLLFRSFKDAQEQILNFAKRNNIKLFAPDILNSSYSFNFNRNNNCLYFGFDLIKGIGVSSINKLEELTKIANSSVGNIKVCLLKSVESASKKLIETLILAGCYDQLNSDRNYMLKMVDVIDDFSKVLKNFDNQEELMSLIDAKMEVSNFKPYTKNELLNNEINLLGFSKQSLKNNNTKKTGTSTVIPLDQEIEVVLINFEEKQSKNGQAFLSCSLKYNDEIFRATISPWKYKKFLHETNFFKTENKYQVLIKQNSNFFNIDKIAALDN